MNQLFEKVKERANVVEVISYFWKEPDRNNKVVCPFHNEKTASLSIDVNNNYWKCFGCGAAGDAIDFVAKLKNIELVDAAKLIADMYGIDYEEKKAKQTIDMYLKRCITNIKQTDYFEKRGLTTETIKKFCLGYDDYRKAVTIPYSGKLTYYQSRSVEDKKFYKPKTEEAGPEPIYNTERIKPKVKELLFVVESPICAMSIEQSGGRAIATCGTGGWRKAAEAIIKVKYQGGIVLSFDNDEPGKEASRNLAKTLEEKDIKFIEYNVAGDKKDPNELLMADSKALRVNVSRAKIEMRKKYATEKDSFNAKELISAEIEPTEWVVRDMLPTGLSFLCAKSKYRKSWMVLQLCLAVAEGRSFLECQSVECGALYYALEDTKNRLQDRLRKMLQGKEASEKVHFALKADTLETGLLDKISEELKLYPDIKLVVIDTLQKVRGQMNKNDTLYGNEYKEMSKVKEFADKNKICILFVHHLRKMADEDDVFNMMSGSTALMGAADTIFVISKKKRTDEDAIFSMTGRDIEQRELVINFNNMLYAWEVEGTPEELLAKKERIEYETNPYIQTIKELVKQNPMIGWSGTASDLMKAVFDLTGKQVVDSSTSVGKLISKYEYRLHCDGIEHKASRSSTRTHTFTKVFKHKPSYQQCMLEDEDEESL